jgi:flagellar biosynthetic protein FliR
VELVQAGLARFLLFGLVLARVGGAMALLPLFGAGVVPVAVRAAFSAVLAVALLPLAGAPPLPQDLVGYAALAVREVVVGTGLGFLARLVLAAVEVGGSLVDLQAGFGLTHVFDPSLGESLPLLGNFVTMLSFLALFLTGGHQLLLASLAASLRRIPIGMTLAVPDAAALVGTLGWAFAAAVGLAASVLGVGLIVTLCLGLLARAVPQLNLLTFGMPVQAGATALTLLATLPVMWAVLRLLGPQAAAAMAGVTRP